MAGSISRRKFMAAVPSLAVIASSFLGGCGGKSKSACPEMMVGNNPYEDFFFRDNVEGYHVDPSRVLAEPLNHDFMKLRLHILQFAGIQYMLSKRPFKYSISKDVREIRDVLYWTRANLAWEEPSISGMAVRAYNIEARLAGIEQNGEDALFTTHSRIDISDKGSSAPRYQIIIPTSREYLDTFIFTEILADGGALTHADQRLRLEATPGQVESLGKKVPIVKNDYDGYREIKTFYIDFSYTAQDGKLWFCDANAGSQELRARNQLTSDRIAAGRKLYEKVARAKNVSDWRRQEHSRAEVRQQ